MADTAMWPADKDAEIVIYCGSGHRSTMAMTILLTEGYTNVTSLKGGFGGWVEAGYACCGVCCSLNKLSPPLEKFQKSRSPVTGGRLDLT